VFDDHQRSSRLRHPATSALSSAISAIQGENAAMSDYATITASTFRQVSLSERTVAAASRVLAGQRCGFRPYLAFVGPAVVASIAYMDPGNFATNIQAGAKYGYTLLWVVLLANVIAMLFQALSAKLGIVTGRNLAEMCR